MRQRRGRIEPPPAPCWAEGAVVGRRVDNSPEAGATAPAGASRAQGTGRLEEEEERPYAGDRAGVLVKEESRALGMLGIFPSRARSGSARRKWRDHDGECASAAHVPPFRPCQE